MPEPVEHMLTGVASIQMLDLQDHSRRRQLLGLQPGMRRRSGPASRRSLGDLLSAIFYSGAPTPLRHKTGTGKPSPRRFGTPPKCQILRIYPARNPLAFSSSRVSRRKAEHCPNPRDRQPLHLSLFTFHRPSSPCDALNPAQGRPLTSHSHSLEIPCLFHRSLGCILVKLHRLLDRCFTCYHTSYILPHAGA